MIIAKREDPDQTAFSFWFWPKRPPSAFSVAEMSRPKRLRPKCLWPPLAYSLAKMSVAEMSGPKRPRPKCPWPKCPTFDQGLPCLSRPFCR